MDVYSRDTTHTATYTAAHADVHDKRRQIGALTSLASAIAAVSGQPTINTTQQLRSVASPPTPLSPVSPATMPFDSDFNVAKWTLKEKQRIKERKLDTNDPEFYLPLGMSVYGKILWYQATIEGWMTKHMPPASAFTKTRKRRYVILVDRMIYTFKKDQPATDFREFFELTMHTNIFATDQFPGILYCLEIQRDEDGRTWYLQADNVEEMKKWMDRLKQTVSYLCLKRSGIVNRAILDMWNGEADAPKKHQKASSNSNGHRSTSRPPIVTSRSTPTSQADVSSLTLDSNVTGAPTPQLETHFKWPDAQFMSRSYSVDNGPSSKETPHTGNSGANARTWPASAIPHRRPRLLLPDILPPQLPPPTTSLPPTPPMM